MTVLKIEIPKRPNQSVSVIVGNQEATLVFREFIDGQHVSISVNGEAVCFNSKIVDLVPIIKYPKYNVIGDFYSVDMAGQENPNYKEWGDRFLFVWSDNQ